MWLTHNTNSINGGRSFWYYNKDDSNKDIHQHTYWVCQVRGEIIYKEK